MIAIPNSLKYVVNGDGAVILDTPNNAMTPLNATGAYVFQRLGWGMQAEDIITELAQETNTDRELVAADVERFVTDLRSRNLLVVS